MTQIFKVGDYVTNSNGVKRCIGAAFTKYNASIQAMYFTGYYRCYDPDNVKQDCICSESILTLTN